MSPSEWLDGLRRIDINDLGTHNMGAWPPAIKVLMGILVAILVLSIGYNSTRD